MHGVHHAPQGQVQELLRSFRSQTPDEFGGVFEVGKEYGDLLTFAFQARAGIEDFFGEMGWRIGQRCCVRRAGPYQYRVGGGWRRSRCTADPDQHGVVLVHRYLVHLDEFEF
jgi:hypothetical protein